MHSSAQLFFATCVVRERFQIARSTSNAFLLVSKQATRATLPRALFAATEYLEDFPQLSHAVSCSMARRACHNVPQRDILYMPRLPSIHAALGDCVTRFLVARSLAFPFQRARTTFVQLKIALFSAEAASCWSLAVYRPLCG